MKTGIVKLMKVLAFGCAATLFVSCDDRNEPKGKGNLVFELTDAPTDDANVKNVFVTVLDIKVDGTSIGNVSKQTLDLKAYTSGSTKLLATAEQFDAKTYNSISLVLDLNEDENGMSPGCFVKTQDGKGYQLKTTTDGTLELVILKPFTVENNMTTQLVIDFDIRKAIANTRNETARYSFVSDNEMGRAIRLIEKKQAGTIHGLFNSNLSLDDKVIVYAYKKGSFNASTEAEPQGMNETYFMNAASSAEVSPSLDGRSFKLAFMEKGDYELYFASYSQSASGRALFKSLLQTATTVNGLSGNTISVEAGGTVNLSSSISVIL